MSDKQLVIGSPFFVYLLHSIVIILVIDGARMNVSCIIKVTME